MLLKQSPFPRGTREVTRRWVYDQASSALFIPLSLYLFITFFFEVAMGAGRESVTGWLKSQPTGIIMILFIGVAVYYKACWFITIIKDYVHDKTLNRLGIIAVKISAWILAFAGIASVLKIIIGN